MPCPLYYYWTDSNNDVIILQVIMFRLSTSRIRSCCSWSQKHWRFWPKRRFQTSLISSEHLISRYVRINWGYSWSEHGDIWGVLAGSNPKMYKSFPVINGNPESRRKCLLAEALVLNIRIHFGCWTKTGIHFECDNRSSFFSRCWLNLFLFLFVLKVT